LGNPEYLLFDTDVMLQVFQSSLRTKQKAFFSRLADTFQVHAAVVPDVEREIRWNGKFRARFEGDFQRIADSAHVVVLEKDLIRRLLQQRGVPQLTADEVLRQCSDRSRRYAQHVDAGEAHTHAVAVELGLPAVTNDFRAIKALIGMGLPTAVPSLRFFDCLEFLRGEGILSPDECGDIRDELRKLKEHVPRPFDCHDPFQVCSNGFSFRLQVEAGGQARPRPTKFDDVLHLSR
jgi:hypothetical protein